MVEKKTKFERRLRKVSDSLYQEDWEEGKRPFNWIREYETIDISLHNIQAAEAVYMDFEATSDFNMSSHKGAGEDDPFIFEKTDKVGLRKSIHATGVITNGIIRIFNEEEENKPFGSFKNIEIEIHPLDAASWKTSKAKVKEKKGDFSMGRLSYEDKYHSEIYGKDKPIITLSLYVPEEQFNQFFDFLIKPYATTFKAIILSIEAAVFRSEVDRGLEEWYHPKDFHIEYKKFTPVFFSSLGYKAQPSFPLKNDDDNLSEEKIEEALEDNFSDNTTPVVYEKEFLKVLKTISKYQKIILFLLILIFIGVAS